MPGLHCESALPDSAARHWSRKVASHPNRAEAPVARILVVIDGDAHVRNTIRTGALGAVLDAHECDILAAEATTDIGPLAGMPEFIGTFRSDASAEARHAVLFDALMWRHRRRSRTFLYRWLRSAGYGGILRDRGPWLRFKSTARWLQSLLGRRHLLRAILLGTEPIHSIARRILARRIPVNTDLARHLEQGDYDLVIHPSNAYEATGPDLVRLTRSTRTRVLALIDNWDNLSSKTVLWAPPDHLGVWGEQSRRHAIEIQRIPEERITVLGTPRFDGYFSARTSPSPSPYPFPYVLFVGAALAVDELEVLRLLDAELSDEPEVYGGLRIVYRPHPWQQPRAVPAKFTADEFRHVLLDVQLQEADRLGQLGEERNDLQPDLDWYPPLLTNARLVMGPLTTMLLEGSLCHRPVLALAHDDGRHFTTPSQALRWYRHFEGIEDIEGLQLCHRLSDLPEMFRALATSRDQPDPERIDDSVAFLLHHDGRPYSARLLETVDRVLADRA
jgi:hypothetical protein